MVIPKKTNFPRFKSGVSNIFQGRDLEGGPTFSRWWWGGGGGGGGVGSNWQYL